MPFLLIALVIFSIVSGQIMLKVGLSTLYKPAVFAKFEVLKTCYMNLLNPYVIFSLFCTGVAGLAWILVIKKMPLGKAYPFISLNYVIISLISTLFFDEVLSMTAIAGIGLIMCGTMLLGLR